MYCHTIPSLPPSALMITDLSDEADKLLVQLALKCAQQNQRVVWSDVARKMQRRLRVSKSPKELETRLRTLKRAHANDLSPTRSRSHSTCNAKTRQPRHHVLDFQATVRLLQSVFGSITNADVRQRAGALHENADELVPQALSEVMNIIGQLRWVMYFSILAVESDMLSLNLLFRQLPNAALVSKFATNYLNWRYSNVQPLLKKVLLLHGDAKETGLSVRQPYFDACIVYLNSFLFANDVKLFVLSELCTLPRARIVVSTEKFCPRHRTPCRNAFCATWQLHQVTSGQEVGRLSL
ncbi:S-adenosyl-L-methionine-dependent methyltransferase [Phytophthora cactorum]|nr:S-adenosyl-L-methionine-dependent methyltransferase [Phytophthora cactorum]